jgi:hypothetical protein
MELIVTSVFRSFSSETVRAFSNTSNTFMENLTVVKLDFGTARTLTAPWGRMRYCHQDALKLK